MTTFIATVSVPRAQRVQTLGGSLSVVAVDRRPDGLAWPHSGDRGMREPAR